MAEHGRKTAGEDDSVVISVGDVVWIVGVVGKDSQTKQAQTKADTETVLVVSALSGGRARADEGGEERELVSALAAGIGVVEHEH